MADGSIKIDTQINTKQAIKALDELEKTLLDLGDDVKDEDITAFKKMANDVEVSTRKIQEQKDMIDSLNKVEIERLAIQKQIAQSSKDITNARNNMQELTNLDVVDQNAINLANGYKQEIKELELTIESARNELSQLKTPEQLSNEITLAEDKMYKFGLNSEIAGNKANRLNESIKPIPEDLSKASDELSTVGAKSEKVAVGMAKASKETKGASRSASSLDKSISKGVKSIAKYALAMFSIRSIYMVISRLAKQSLDADDERARQSKANLEFISTVLSNLFIPVMAFITNMLVTILGYVNMIAKAFFGVDLNSKKTSKNVGKTTGATKKLNKELKKSSAHFDEFATLSKDTSDNMGSAGGGASSGLPDVTMGSPDISGFTKALDKIKDKIKEVFSSETFQSYMNSFKSIFTSLSTALISITSNLVGNVIKMVETLLPNSRRAFDAMVELGRRFLEDLATGLEKWLPRMTGNFNQLVDDIFSTFTPFLNLILKIIADVLELVLGLWNKYGKDIIDSVLEFVNKTLVMFFKLWDIVDAIISPIIDALEYVWDNGLKEMINQIASFVIELGLAVLQIYNKFVAPLIGFLAEYLQPAFAVVFGAIGGIVSAAFLYVIEHVSNLFRTVRGVMNGIIEFITGVFTGNWKRAWQGVVNIFSSIFDGIGHIIKAPINFLIDSLNGFLRGINKIKIPSWVPGIGGAGFNIPEMKRLQKGGVVNRPTNALIGEAGSEVVMPLDNNNGWINSLASQIEALIGGTNSSGQTVVVNLDGQVLLKALSKALNENNMLGNGGMTFE